MNKRLKTMNKVLIISVFILIALVNFIMSPTTIIGTVQCKHDTLIMILRTAAKWIEYIGLIGGIIFVITSKYKNKKYRIGIKIIILIALIIPFVLSTCAYFIEENDQKNNNCTISEINWE